MSHLPGEDLFSNYFELKQVGLERILGPMHNMVGHAIIPFQVGGAVDIYYFPNAIEGTAIVTMELIEPDGTGPMSSSIGTYELIAFTKIANSDLHMRSSGMDLHLRNILTSVARYSYQAVLNPLETMEVPAAENKPNLCLILDQWQKPGIEFKIGTSTHGLLLCIEVFRTEMEFAMQNGSLELIKRLNDKQFYPYSDLEREPVA